MPVALPLLLLLPRLFLLLLLLLLPLLLLPLPLFVLPSVPCLFLCHCLSVR